MDHLLQPLHKDQTDGLHREYERLPFKKTKKEKQTGLQCKCIHQM